MKQIYELTASDFDTHRIWESSYWPSVGTRTREADEATVQPAAFGKVIYGDTTKPQPLLIAANGRLKNGTLLRAFIYAPVSDSNLENYSISYIQPTLFLPSGQQCMFWTAIDRLRVIAENDFSSECGNNCEKMFPVVISAADGLLDVKYKIVVNAFASAG